MKQILKTEEVVQFLFAIYLLYDFQASWWWYGVLILGPDIGMLGYLGGNKAGAFMYNLFHHKGLAVAVTLAGMFLPSQVVLLSGIILFGHSSMDRTFGYGLKTTEGFKFTHLGIIGKQTI